MCMCAGRAAGGGGCVEGGFGVKHCNRTAVNKSRSLQTETKRKKKKNDVTPPTSGFHFYILNVFHFHFSQLVWVLECLYKQMNHQNV